MKLVARLLTGLLLAGPGLALPTAVAVAVAAWPAGALAAEDDEGTGDACGDDSEDVDPPSDEPEDPEPAE